MRWTRATQIGDRQNGGRPDQVLDNGCGMNETDARFAVERHATSKIYSDEDLFRIAHLAFGERLWLPLPQSPTLSC